MIFILLVALSSFTLSANQSIKLPLNNWASQKVLSMSVGTLLEERGVKVEYINIQLDKQWGALARGRLHFQVEVWSPSMKNAFIKYPRVLDAGTHAVRVREDWWYPNWVEPLCPGLPDWQALNACSHIFSTDDSSIGTFYTGPWDYNDPELIRALELNFKIHRVKSDEQLWKLLKVAQVDKKPILLLNWSPNWTDSEVSGSFVEFPPYSVECETNPEYGINKDMTHDCGNPLSGWLKKAKWSKLEANYPCVNAFIENINFNNNMISRASVLGSDRSLTLEQAVKLWLKEFTVEARGWLPRQCEMSPKLKTQNF